MLLIISIRIGKFVNHHCRADKRRDLDYYFIFFLLPVCRFWFFCMLQMFSRSMGCSADIRGGPVELQKHLGVLNG